MITPEEFIKTIRKSFYGSVIVYTRGSCSQLFNIVSAVFSDAEMYSNENHVIIKIGNKFYDITGEITSDDFEYTDLKTYDKVDRYGKIDHHFDIGFSNWCNDIDVSRFVQIRDILIKKYDIRLEVISTYINYSKKQLKWNLRSLVYIGDDVIDAIQKFYGIDIQDETYIKYIRSIPI